MARLVILTIRNKAYQLVYWPALIACVFASLFGIFFGKLVLFSALSGIIVWAVPTFYFVYRVFSKIQTDAKRWVISFYRAEIIKLTISAIIFILIYKLFEISLLPLLIGYMIAQISFLIFAGLRL